MNVRQGFKMSVKSILSNKVRSLLTMLGIIIGVAAVMILVSVVQGQNKANREYMESLGTNKVNVSAYSYNGKDISQPLYDFCLSLKNSVVGVTPNGYAWGNVVYMATSTEGNQEMGSPQVSLGSDQYSLCNNFTIAQGRDISYLDVKHYNQVIVIGAKLKEYLFQYKNPIGEKITFAGQKFEVIGVYEAKETAVSGAWIDYMAVVPYTLSRTLTPGQAISEYIVKAKSASATTEVITRLNGFLMGQIDPNNGYYNVYSNNEWMQESEEQNKMQSYVLGGIAGVSLLVGGIGIMNIMLVTVRERTREIGIRRAIGGSRKTILIQFLIEAAVICAVGGLFGIAVGSLGTLIAGKITLDTVLLPNGAMTIAAFVFSVVLGITFGMYPAIKASGLLPVEALRAE